MAPPQSSMIKNEERSKQIKSKSSVQPKMMMKERAERKEIEAQEEEDDEEEEKVT